MSSPSDREPVYAHSLPDRPKADWEPLSDHLAEVGDRAAEFAERFGWAAAAGVAGRLHDIGKCSAEFQAYIAQARDDGGPRGPDHSTAGAREAERLYPGPLGRMLAYAVAGHHAGLSDYDDLARRVDPKQKQVADYDGWQAHAQGLPENRALMAEVSAAPFRAGAEKGFSHAFLTRMLFSCLVDADSLATEQFYAKANGEPVERGNHTPLATLRDRLRAHMQAVQADAPATDVNTLRAKVLAHATAKAALDPGLFTLTVPTGGGKTLASLSFALEHAVRHGLKRVIYVIPFTSIIEQTAEVFRRALSTQTDVLEHHASFDWEHPRSVADADSEGPDGLRKLRRASENWDAPIVVTTAVQFFESLFANRRSRCRKLHNIARSVIVLDEAQTLPLPVLRPSLAALDELARNYGASVVVCTATQPAWRKLDEALVDKNKRAFGLEIGEDRELAPDPPDLYQKLKRVAVEHLAEPVEDAVIAARFVEQPQMLCIVNSRKHARDLYDLIKDQAGAVHLTTLMCPKHRQAMLAKVRADLTAEEPVRLVATSLIEAGVDVDFPEVWRAAAGLDSIIQAAGRCNREGDADLGRTVVFTPAEARPPRSLDAFWQAARPVLRQHADPLSLAAVRHYFRELYWQKGEESLDASKVGERTGVLPALSERARELTFAFASIAGGFHLIDDLMAPVVVPWDEDARRLLAKIAAQDRPFGGDLRALQKYTVGIPPKARRHWLAAGVLRPVHAGLGDALLRFDDLAHYDERTGVRLDDPSHRAAESNVI